MMIEVTTQYTKESYRKFQWFHSTRKGVRKVVFITYLAIMICVAVTLLFMLLIDGRNLIATLFISLSLLFLSMLYILRPHINANSTFKKNPSLFDAELTFTFHENYFTLQTKGMVIGTSDIPYEALYRVYQTKDYFYLYAQQRLSYIIDKADFTVGKPQDLAVLLEKAIPAKKYRSYVK